MEYSLIWLNGSGVGTSNFYSYSIEHILYDFEHDINPNIWTTEQ